MIKKHFVKKYFEKASENMMLCHYKKAIKYLDKILFLDKNNIDAIAWKGHCYACIQNKSESIKCYDLAFKLQPDSDELMRRKGSSYCILEEYELAINCFKKIYNQNYQDIFLLSEIGSSYLYLGNYPKALFYFNEILKINKNNSDAYKSIGLVYQFQEEHDVAIKYFNIALDIDSENIVALVCKSNSLLTQGFFHESLQCLNKALSVKDDIMTKLTKSYVLSYLGKFEESLQGFKEIKNLNIDDYSLIRSYHSYYAKSLANMERLDDALKVYDEFLDNYPFSEYIKKDRDELFEKVNGS